MPNTHYYNYHVTVDNLVDNHWSLVCDRDSVYTLVSTPIALRLSAVL